MKCWPNGYPERMAAVYEPRYKRSQVSLSHKPRRSPVMIGTPPSGRESPAEPEVHSHDFSRRWVNRLDKYCAVRMEELGRPEDELGADVLRKHKR
jgi:hypothetical protein